MPTGVDFYNRRKGGGPMGVKVEHRVGVHAPVELVWELIYDVAGWPAWNPIYPKAAGVVRIGERLNLTRALPGQPHKQIQPVVLEWTPNELLHLKRSELAGLVTVTHYWEVDKLAEENCIFSCGEMYSGFLGPSVARSLRGSLKRGYIAVADAMKAHAEAAWQAKSDALTSGA